MDSDSSNNWRHLASGEVSAILNLEFLTSGEYYINKINVRPITSYLGKWYVSSIQLWKDMNGDKKLSIMEDSLLDTLSLKDFIMPQESPKNFVTFHIDSTDSIPVHKDTLFFISARVENWRDTITDNIEVDTTEDGPNGVWFSLVDSSQDISFYPQGSVRPDTTIKYFFIRAVNQQILIRNANPTEAEYDSVKRNMFFPEYRTKSQRIDSLFFYADVFLPEEYNNDSLDLKSASFCIGYDNTILDLELDSISFGDMWKWNEFTHSYVDTTVQISDRVIENKPNYSLIYFETTLKNSLNDTSNFVKFKSNSIANFKFHVIKPGISPIFLRDVNIIDRWGIPYHTYRQLQNYSTGDQPADSNEYDAWSKFILGDFTSSDSGDVQINMNGEGDAEVNWADITLFSDYIWKNISDPNWYSRFDIGSPDSHNPDELSPDDTTNFFDLMIMGTNYYRTLAGSFNQKPVSVVNEKINASLSELEQIDNSDQYLLKFSLSNAVDLSSIHAKIHYNTEDLEFFDIEAGNWVKNVSPNHLLLFPAELIEQGKIDINFIALDNPLCGEGDFALIKFKRLKNGEPDVIPEYLEFRNTDCEKVEYVIKGSDDIKELPNESFFLKNYPNPFNPNTEISYTIPGGKDGIYKLEIYDIGGKLVKTLSNSYHTTGRYKQFWDGKNMDKKSVGSGIYFLCLSSYNFTKTMKIMLMR